MKQNEMYSKIASLESRCDLLETELDYLNRLLVRCGFSDGLRSFKMTVEALLSEETENNYLEE